MKGSKFRAEPERVIQVFASLDRAGAETMLMNIYRSIDRSNIQFDFVVNESVSEYDYEEEIKALGGRIFYAPRPALGSIWRYLMFWWHLFSNHPEIRVVHAHHTSPALVYGLIAKIKGRKLVAHSHITGSDKGFKSFVKRIVRYPLKFMADKLLACSGPAAIWMFGKNNSAVILKNAISMEAFLYSEDKRLNIRRDYEVDGFPAVLHVGRFDDQKNHFFLVDCFKKYRKSRPSAKLYLIGAGPLKASLEHYVAEVGLEESVVFVGTTSDVASWMSAADVFLFPSRYEGLGLVLIEAQAAGLPCVVSTGVPEEVAITSLVHFCSLDDGLEKWSAAIERALEVKGDRTNVVGLRNSGYEVSETSKELIEIYESILEPS